MQPFRLKVLERYGTVGTFAKAMHWSHRKASYVTTGRQELKESEMEACAEALGVENIQDFMRIFHPRLFTKWTDEKGA